ncbi:MAG: NAD kinase [Cyclobacteriaceae bacterium]|nr:NAD kinase [Cyclobacteriaceae bacterium]
MSNAEGWIAVHGNFSKKEILPFLDELLQVLRSRNVKILISDKFHKKLRLFDFDLSDTGIFSDSAGLSGAKAFLSIGGDGTFLESVKYVGRSEVPILGINTGRLGFLAYTPKEHMQKAIDSILNREFTVEDRLLVEVVSDEDVFDGLNFGLNEFTILKQDTSSMITVKAYLDGEFLNAYWADGLIIATPTGSTGYSLSCGGPVVLPFSQNFIITPVSPHNLSIRPLVVPAKSSIELEVEARTNFFLVSIDSRSNIVPVNKKFTIKRCGFDAHLIKFEQHSFFDTLRMKLNWGYDIRN